jgi:hypothetical protein
MTAGVQIIVNLVGCPVVVAVVSDSSNLFNQCLFTGFGRIEGKHGHFGVLVPVGLRYTFLPGSSFSMVFSHIPQLPYTFTVLVFAPAICALSVVPASNITTRNNQPAEFFKLFIFQIFMVPIPALS